jgi:NitT/TauT family transport system ATP-binding protein
MSNNPIVRLQNVTKIYHSPASAILAIKNISLAIYPDEFVSIVGPSGCGKTTILSMIAGIEPLSYGEIVFSHDDLLNEKIDKQRVGYMLQQDYLFEWRTILENIYLGLEIRHALTPTSKHHVMRLIETYGLKDFIDRYPHQLSGGMRQRAALIRTLATNPDILLLDEPFSALDYQTRLNVVDDVASIIAKEKKTALLVTHDIAEAVSMSDRVAILTDRPATVKQIHTINLPMPKDQPLSRRKCNGFGAIFQTIWEELSS